jgi:drug/metabolite transporter (DMT)-like permease
MFKSTTTKVVLAFAAIYFVWGSTYLAIRYCIETIPPFLLVGVRFGLAGAILYGASRLSGSPKPSSTQWVSCSIIGAMLLAAGNGLVVWSELRVASSTAALLIAMVPLWIALFAWGIRGERPSGRALAGISVGLAGIVLLVSGQRAGSGDMLGFVSLLAASLSWALGSVLAKSLPLPASSVQATGMEMMAGGAVSLLVSALLREPHHLELSRISSLSLWSFAYLVVFGSLVGFTAYTFLLRTVPVSLLSTYAYVNPVVAMILGVSLGGEHLTSRTLIAASVILGGVVMMSGSVSAARPETEQLIDLLQGSDVPTHPARTGAAPGCPSQDGGAVLRPDLVGQGSHGGASLRAVQLVCPAEEFSNLRHVSPRDSVSEGARLGVRRVPRPLEQPIDASLDRHPECLPPQRSRQHLRPSSDVPHERPTLLQLLQK